MYDDDQDHEWRFRWWLADTLDPYLRIILSGLIAATLGCLIAASPWTIPLLALAAACAWLQTRS